MASAGSALMKARSKPINLKPSKKGSLHTALGIPQGQPIPGNRLAAAARSTNADIKRKAVFAQNAKGWNH
jgi:hypothetical protein